jgi:hypothetical protein
MGDSEMFVPDLLRSQSESITQDASGQIIATLKPDAAFLEPLYFREKITLSRPSLTDFPFIFALATFSVTPCCLENLVLKGTFQFTARAKLTARHCKFVLLDPTDPPPRYIIKVYARSSARFIDCEFEASAYPCVYVADHSQVEFENCRFSSPQASVYVSLVSSSCRFTECLFDGGGSAGAICLSDQSNGLLGDCVFRNLSGRALFVSGRCWTSLSKCLLENTGGIACWIADRSRMSLEQCCFANAASICVYCERESQLICSRSVFDNGAKNAIILQQSSGLIDCVLIRKFAQPAISIYGPASNPIIQNTKILDLAVMGIVVREWAVPTFFNVVLEGAGGIGCSLSDFVRPRFIECQICGPGKTAISSFNAARPDFNGCTFRNFQLACDVFNLSHPRICGCIFDGCAESLRVAYRGKVSSNSDNFFRDDTDTFTSCRLSTSHFTFEEPQETDPELVQETVRASLQRDASLPQTATARIQLSSGLVLPDSAVSGPLPARPRRIGSEEFARDTQSFAVPRSFSTAGWELPIAIEMPDVIVPIEPELREKLPLMAEWEAAFTGFERKVSIDDEKKVPIGRMEVKPFSELLKIFQDEDFSPDPDQKCQICQQEVQAICSPCGHRVFCQNCAAHVDKTGAVCPLCSVPVKQVTRVYAGSDACTLCLTAKPDTVLLPCGHMAICASCGNDLWESSRACPVCSTRVLAARHIFPT